MNFWQKIFAFGSKEGNPQAPHPTKKAGSFGGGYALGGSSSGYVSTMRLDDSAGCIAAFTQVAELAAPIRYAVDAYSSFKYELFRFQKNGKRIKLPETTPLLQQLRNPNPFQTNTELNKQLYGYYLIDGNAYQYMGVPNKIAETQGVTPENLGAMYVLPSQFTKIYQKSNSKIFYAQDIQEVIDYYWVSCGYQYKFSPETVTHVNQLSLSFSDRTGIAGDLPLSSLYYYINNVIKALRAQGTAVERGYGILGVSPIPVDEFKTTGDTLDPDEKKAMEDELRRHGTQPGDYRMLRTTQPMNFQEVGWSLKDMGLGDIIEEAQNAICKVTGIPYGLFQQKNSKFNDLELAEKAVFEQKFIPDSQAFERALNKKLGLPDRGLYLKFSYDHLRVLQSDMKTVAEINAQTTETLLSVIENYKRGIVDYGPALEIIAEIKNTTTEDAKKYLPEPIESEIPSEIEPEGNEGDEKKSISAKFNAILSKAVTD